MDAMRRFNQISAVICLLVACVPMAYAQDIEPGATMGVAAPPSTFARVYQHGQSGVQDLTKTLACHQKVASQGDVEAQYKLAKMYEDRNSILLQTKKMRGNSTLLMTLVTVHKPSRLPIHLNLQLSVCPSHFKRNRLLLKRERRFGVALFCCAAGLQGVWPDFRHFLIACQKSWRYPRETRGHGT